MGGAVLELVVKDRVIYSSTRVWWVRTGFDRLTPSTRYITGLKREICKGEYDLLLRLDLIPTRANVGWSR